MNTEKTAVQRELQEAWDDVRRLVDSLPEREMTEVPVVEGWTVKDLLGHMAFWAEKAAEDLRAVAAGRVDEVLTPGSAEDVAEWNKREAERRRGQSLDEARREWESSFQAAKDALAAFPPERLDEDVQGWKTHVRFAVDTYHHYGEHAAQVRARQRQLETSEA